MMMVTMRSVGGKWSLEANFYVLGERKAELEALGENGDRRVWSKRRGSGGQIRQLPDPAQSLWEKSGQADNAFAEIHQSGRFPNVSDLSHSLFIISWALVKMGTIGGQSTFKIDARCKFNPKKKGERKMRYETKLLTAVSRCANKW